MNSSLTDPNLIFVFGSNLAGRHGKGAALTAAQYFGAVRGVGEGPTGRAYALPTKSASLVTLPLCQIRESVARFLAYACCHPSKTFIVTAVGCGLAGYEPSVIAPLFSHSPENVFVSPRFLSENAASHSPR